MRNILDYSFEELAEFLGAEKYRGKQIFEWLRGGTTDFSEMKNLPAALRNRLNAEFSAKTYEVIAKRVSKDGTSKVLGGFLDKNTAEAVLMKYVYGYSACISTQVGCRMGCTFCASAKCGFVRNLSAGEMLGEVYALTRLAGVKLSNIVLMGMGEPLDNYENVLLFLRRLTDPVYYGLSARSVTISTCGLVGAIDRLAGEKLQVTLAISLHNPFQAQRMEIMPVARSYSVGEVLDAARRYFDSTGRRVTLEYAMIADVNDTLAHARELARMLESLGRSAFHVNLIPLNAHELTEQRGSARARVEAFRSELAGLGINSTVRRELGADIDAACGQLKNNWRNYG